MSDIDTYLSQLRAPLTDLDPKRADEIIIEARTHLESRMAQLESTGLDSDHAAAKALRSFGDPQQVARDLVQSNASHRRPLALRAVAALTISLGSWVALVRLINTPACGEHVVKGFIMPLTGLGPGAAASLLLYGASVPIALLTGMVGGRRFWWLAASPIVLGSAGIFALRLLYSPPNLPIGWEEALVGLLVKMPVFVGAFAALGWLGSRLPSGRPASSAAAALCASFVAAVWLGALVTTYWADSVAASGEHVLFATLALPLLLFALVAGRRDRWLSRDAFIASVSVLCSVGLLFILGMALSFSGAARWALRAAGPWLTIAAILCLAGLLAIFVYAARTGSWFQRTSPPRQ